MLRTDLALEAREMYRQSANEEATEVPGIEVENAGCDGVIVTRVKITSDEGEAAMGKPKGIYITIEAPGLRQSDEQLHEKVAGILAGELSSVTTKRNSKGDTNSSGDDTILVVGLGNWNVTPDALGPKVVSKLDITRHLLEYMPGQIPDGTRPVCALAPGVLGLTGIETSEIVKGLSDKIKPDLIIAIDALASRKMDRVSTTIQIADTGIIPGSGVGNRRKGLTIETLGVPVVAVGVPTVVDAATIANDTIDLILDSILEQMENDCTKGTESTKDSACSGHTKDRFYRELKTLNSDERSQLIRDVLSPSMGDFMVTPKEVDTLIDNISKIIAIGINNALNKPLF